MYKMIQQPTDSVGRKASRRDASMQTNEPSKRLSLLDTFAEVQTYWRGDRWNAIGQRGIYASQEWNELNSYLSRARPASAADDNQSGQYSPVRTSVLISLLLVATFLIGDLFLEWQSIRDATLFFFFLRATHSTRPGSFWWCRFSCSSSGKEGFNLANTFLLRLISFVEVGGRKKAQLRTHLSIACPNHASSWSDINIHSRTHRDGLQISNFASLLCSSNSFDCHCKMGRALSR